jgi:DNA repair photolyase
MDDTIPDLPRKGRGAVSNRAGRYEAHTAEAVDDGWGAGLPVPGDGDGDGDDDAPPPLRTTLTRDTSKSIIARNNSPDVPFDRSINPYRGCEHGCIYCFARPTHAWLGLSPGLDFESRLFFKPEAARLLERELRKPSYECRVLAMGTNTDPYQPVEKKLGITREILKLLSAFNHPVGIVTKSALVARDIDILSDMASRGLAQVCVSVTTLDSRLAMTLEPRAPTPKRRLATIRALAEAGIPTGVMAAPVIPALTDPEMESILRAAREAGAQTASYILLRLPLEISALFREWLEAHAPDKAARVMAILREARGGADYDSTWGRRMTGMGPHAEMLRQRFEAATRRLGYDTGRRFRLETGLFRPPLAGDGQLALF